MKKSITTTVTIVITTTLIKLTLLNNSMEFGGLGLLLCLIVCFQMINAGNPVWIVTDQRPTLGP